MENSPEKLLQVEDLSVEFKEGEHCIQAVRGISYTLFKGETLALVGESGSGKSVSALSILKLLPYPKASHPSGKILYKNQDLLHCSEKDLRKIRGNKISVIFQEPMTSLNPLHTVEKQICEVLELHQGLRKNAATQNCLELLERVGIPNAKQRMKAYPHELSGGQRQRVMIAMALASEPEILIADEPTTALDVTIQLQILELLSSLQKQLQLSILLITHDLGLVKHFSQRVAVMKEGKIVETGTTEQVLSQPQHEYTRSLINASPKPLSNAQAVFDEELIQAKNVKVWFPLKKGLLNRTYDYVKAVDGISFTLHKGQTIGIVGESGSGKTTLGLALAKLLHFEGEVSYRKQRLDTLNQKQFRPYRKKIQMVFQDPFGSLSPRMSIAEIVGEGLEIHSELQGPEKLEAIKEALLNVGLNEEVLNRYPHEFSGGQRQRIAIARALVLNPEVIIFDEPTSALDRSVQVQVVELLQSLQKKFQLAYLFISHDLSVIKALSHEIIVMKDGVVLEKNNTAAIFESPQNPYTQALINAAFDRP
ncbi:MAG: ABC transporter ATP-binding protein [Pseudomonadales bacterium]|nr:ABC transporter ATP-binding protein [Pseudomonadales bacterium]